MWGVNELADKVRRERLNRGWSVRQASSAGRISNTYWGEFEDYKRQLTPTIAAAVAKAYDWPADWPDGEVTQLTRRDDDRFSALERAADALRVELAASIAGKDRLAEMTNAALAEMRGELALLTRRVDEIESRGA